MTRFKALLVYPNLQMVNLLPPNIAILSAYLKDGGMDVKVFDATLYKTAEKSVDDIRVEHMQLRPFNLEEKGVCYKNSDIFKDFTELVEDYNPNIIGVSATDDTYDLGMALIAKVRHKCIHVVVGGVYPTFSAEEALNNENVDSICIGEGEMAIVDLCQNLAAKKDINRIPNIWVKKDGRIFKNEIRKAININETLYEDFSVFEEKRLFRPMQGKIYRMIPISPDRGCPYNCSFCAAPLINSLYKKSTCAYFRIKSIDRVMDELLFQVKKYRADYIYFNSETFFVRSDKELEKFSKEYSKKINLPFWCQTRVDTINERKVKFLKDMNCDRISVGIEHGNEEFRKKILKKNFTNKQVVEAFEILKKNKIPVTVNNIIGFPDETRELVFDTIKLNRDITADSINAYFFVPYSGTPLRQYCIDKKYIQPNVKTDSLHRNSALNMPQFPPDQIKGLVRAFPLYVKMPKRYFDKIKIAEQLTEEGDQMLNELREIYFRRYFK